MSNQTVNRLRRKFNLNERQAKFALAKGLGATNRAAYKQAGYEAKSQGSADATACGLLKNPKLQNAVDDVFTQHAQQLGEKWSLSKDKILKDFELLKKEGFKRGQIGPAVRANELQGRAIGVRFDHHVSIGSEIPISDDSLAQVLSEVLGADAQTLIDKALAIDGELVDPEDVSDLIG